MSSFDNVFLFMQSDDAMEALRSGDAKLSSGGIRKADGTFMELAKPAYLSAKDFLSIIDDKIASQSNCFPEIIELRMRMNEVERANQISWLNYETIQNVYTLTYEGFNQTLLGVAVVKDRIEKLSITVLQHYIRDDLESAQRFMNFMKTDYGNLCSNKYDVTNGNIAEHLDEISAYLKRLINEVINDVEGSKYKLEIVMNLIIPFSNLVRRYSALYFYDNDFLPGNHEEWFSIIEGSLLSHGFMINLQYYVNLYAKLPFRARVKQFAQIKKKIQMLGDNIRFDEKYIESHTREEYRDLPNKINESLNSNSYYSDDNGLCIFI